MYALPPPLYCRHKRDSSRHIPKSLLHPNLDDVQVGAARSCVVVYVLLIPLCFLDGLRAHTASLRRMLISRRIY